MLSKIEDSEDLIVGRLVACYRVLDRLVGDGQRQLYVAEHLHLDRRVALRLIAPRVAGAARWTAGALDRFLEEARKLSQVKHGNVLELVDLGETGDGYVYLATELPRGPTLDREIAEHGTLSGTRARIIGRQIGAALRAAADVSPGHRDITLQQVFLLTQSGQRGQAGQAWQGGNTDLVKVDFATADILSREAVPRSDAVQVLGRLLYEMVVGKPPVAEANEAPPDPILARPDLDISADLDALIVRALDPDPTKRWPDIDSMLHVLAAEEEKRASAAGDGERYPQVGDGAATEHWKLGRIKFERPSPRALISGGVAACLTLALIIAIATTRRVGPVREQAVISAAMVQPPALARSAGGEELTRSSAFPVSAAGSAAAAPNVADGSISAAVPGTTPSGAVDGSESGASPAVTGVVAAALAPTARMTVEAGGSTRQEGDAPPAAKLGAGGQQDLERTRPPREGEAKPAVALRANEADDACAVTLGSQPWSSVKIDGRHAGFTPVIDYPVDCGEHEVIFKPVGSDVETRVPISVLAGQVFKKVVDLTGKDRASGGLTAASAAGVAEPPGCLVTLGSRPASEIWIDGKRVGATPLVDYGISCGKHDVVFRSGESDVERRETIVVHSGQTLKKVVALAQKRKE